MLFRQIEYFQAVVECGNFYAAAEACHVSQSAVSQQIRKLENELGVSLLDRHNRTFTLTPAGEHFYRKSLILRSDLEQLVRGTRRIGSEESDTIRLGCYTGYQGSEFSDAIARFAEKYPDIRVQVMIGSHEELYQAMENGTVDLALNDQRRAFSGAYHNVVLSTSRTYIEISARNPLNRLDQIDIRELKNLPCILVIPPEGQREEQRYYEEIVGLQSEFSFAESLQEARLMLITGRGYLPVDVIGEPEDTDSAVTRILLTRNGEPVSKAYCAFWKKDNSGYYVEEFAEILKDCF